MHKLLTGLTILVGAVALAGGAQAAKYKEVKVANGGAISGKVLLGGAKVEAESFLITKDPDVCGKGQRVVKWVRANNGGLLDAVVYIEKIKAGKAFSKKTRKLLVDQKKCTFVPFLGVIANGGQLQAVNSDPVTHNIHTYELIKKARRTVINVSQSQQGSTIKKKIKLRRGHAMKVECDVHNFMHGWVFVAKNPYYAVVDGNGGFTISDIPPGKYVVRAWHGRLGEKKATVTVKAGATAKVKFSY